MPEKARKLVLSFNAESQTYQPTFHNLEPQAAIEQVDQLNSDGLTAAIVDQTGRHLTVNAANCRFCKQAAAKFTAEAANSAAVQPEDDDTFATVANLEEGEVE